MMNILKVILLVGSILLEVRAKEVTKDFIDKYNKYFTVCKGMGFQTRNCSVKKEENIAFHARLSKTQVNLGSTAVVVFGKITQNSGNAYNANTGKFTAPDDGLYYFQWTILTTEGKYFHTEIVLNGKIIGYNHADGVTGSSNRLSGSSSAVIKMKRKEDVWIRVHGAAGKYAYADWSSFTSFKL
ncbi:heavy metal-binding protein HIP-like [Saccostrea cucullata]|uniref:heavy metal-binding protein HIP-like n=1 Tax=Saccostrea cuccullata TaxID=36930 RepID=UPI002ED54463